MAKITVTSNITKVSARYKALLRKLPQAVDAGMRKLMTNEGIPLYKATVRTWRGKPVFKVVKGKRGWAISASPDVPYKWVDFGTRRHIIRAKNAPFLVFRYPYRAATKPNWISSRNAQTGDNWARKKQVNHPGTEARNFTDIISKRLQARAKLYVKREVDALINSEGFGL